MWRAHASLRALLLLSSLLIAATLVAAVAVLLDLCQKELEHGQSEIVSLTRMLAEQTTHSFDGVALTLRGARERISDERGQRLELDGRPLQQLLQARATALPQVKSLFLVDRHGRRVNSSHADGSRRRSPVSADFLARFTSSDSEQLLISQPERAPPDGRWTFYAGVRLADAQGQLRGVLVAAIDIDYLEALYASIELDFVSRIRLLKSDGTLLAGQPHDATLFGQPALPPALLARLAAQPPTAVIVGEEQLPGGRQFVALRQVANYPLLVSAAIAEDDALTPWRHVRRPIIAGAALVIVFAVLATWLMARNLLRELTLEDALKERDAQLRHLVQSASDAIFTVDSARRVVLFNAAAERMFGVDAKTAVGGDLEQLLARSLEPPQAAALLRHLDAGWRAAGGQVFFANIESTRAGQAFSVELNLSTTTFRERTLHTAIFRDLTASQRAEREVLETNRQLQELSASLERVREQERSGIARELHDELGQMLTGMRLEVSWLGTHLNDGEAALGEKLASIKTQIDQTIAAVRRMSSELRPLVLDDLGLAAAVGWYVDQFSARTGLPVDLQLPAADPPRGEATATALFRVLQEALTNVARHALATRAEVRLELRDERWRLAIRDDGVGFAYTPGRGGDIGLVGMRERAQILGGQFSVSTAPGAGTLIEVTIPCRKEAS